MSLTSLTSDELGREEGRKRRHCHKIVSIPKGRENEFSSKGHLRNSIKWDKTQVTGVTTAFVLIMRLGSESWQAQVEV